MKQTVNTISDVQHTVSGRP